MTAAPLQRRRGRSERLAARARIFPVTGWAAIKVDEEEAYTTWAAFWSIDTACDGSVPRQSALELIQEWRGVTRRSARRVLREGERLGYWTSWISSRDEIERMTPASTVRLMGRFGIEVERVPRLISLSRLRTRREMREQLFATVYEIPGHSGVFLIAPLSRGLKEELTVVPIRSQKRYDAGASALVQRMSAEVEVDPAQLGAMADAVGDGWYVGRHGGLYRRLPDLRTPRDQVLLSRSASRHARTRARQLQQTQGCGRRDQPPGGSPWAWPKPSAACVSSSHVLRPLPRPLLNARPVSTVGRKANACWSLGVRPQTSKAASSSATDERTLARTPFGPYGMLGKVSGRSDREPL